MSPPAAPAPVTLVTGPEELLASRAVAQVVAAARAVDPAAEVRDIAAGGLTEPDLLDLSSPSLFAELRVVVVRGAAELGDEQRDALLAYARSPLPGVVLVVVHGGGTRGKRLVDGLTAAGAQVVAAPALTRASQRWEFVQAEARAAGLPATAGGCRALVEAVGTDLRQLASAVAQLAADGAEQLDEPTVARLRAGRAETRGFDVADAALAGDLPAALALLAAALQGGTAPVLVSAALAAGLRDLARVRGAGAGDPAALARRLGMPPWKVERSLRAARGWSDPALAAAVRVVAAADAGVKGAGADPAYQLTRTLVSLHGLRAGR